MYFSTHTPPKKKALQFYRCINLGWIMKRIPTLYIDWLTRLVSSRIRLRNWLENTNPIVGRNTNVLPLTAVVWQCHAIRESDGDWWHCIVKHCKQTACTLQTATRCTTCVFVKNVFSSPRLISLISLISLASHCRKKAITSTLRQHIHRATGCRPIQWDTSN